MCSVQNAPLWSVYNRKWGHKFIAIEEDREQRSNKVEDSRNYVWIDKKEWDYNRDGGWEPGEELPDKGGV